MKKFEYCETNIFTLPLGKYGYRDTYFGFEGDVLDILNKFGSLGWELVAIKNDWYIFKREVLIDVEL